MSNLGIRFAYPYRGSGGIIVNGGVISIDPTATIEVDGVVASGTVEAANLTSSGAVSFDNGLIQSDGAGNFLINDSLFVEGTTTLDNGDITTDGSGNAVVAGNLQAGNIVTPLLTFDPTDTEINIDNPVAGAITPSLTNYLPATVNGNPVKLVIGS
jgi:hypothetical protein